jgi:hypothetical protein
MGQYLRLARMRPGLADAGQWINGFGPCSAGYETTLN